MPATATTGALPGPTVGPLFASGVSGNGHYLLDQHGSPYLMVGDSSWEICVNIPTSDATVWITSRQTQGFNAQLLDLIASNYDANAWDAAHSSDTWKTFDGLPPFYKADGVTLGTGPIDYDCTQPYPPYWARVDAVVQAAQAAGITLQVVGLGECVYGAGGTTADQNFYAAMGQTKLNTFATWLANRYMPYGNITWLLGADYFPSVQGSSNNTALVGMAQSIITAWPTALITMEANDGVWFSQQSGSVDLTTDLAIFTNGSPSGSQVKAGINTVYDNRPGGPGPNSSPDFYRAYNLSPAVPFIHGEGNYENAPGGKGATTVALCQQLCRAYAWCNVLCGATGWFYGEATVWYNGPNWKSFLQQPGQAGTTIAARYFQSIQWWRLVPDQSATFVTSVNSVSPSNWASGPLIGIKSTGPVTGNYGGAAAVTALGDLGLVYCHQSDTVTVAMSNMRGTTTARWLDPTNSFFTTIGSFANTGSHTFSNGSTNSAGQTDWVLVLTA